MIHFSVPVNSADIIILLIIGVMFLLGIRVVMSFFKRPVALKTVSYSGDVTFHKGDKLHIVIDGMMCGMCESHIKDAIRKAVPEVKDVTASHESGEAGFTVIEEEDREVLLEKLRGAIHPLGYRIIGDIGVKH
ncbi:copper chaperone [Lachnospiraceae bacterium JC7]|nr:copper chaperone [Lachnospiraceae bacterium JC7]